MIQITEKEVYTDAPQTKRVHRLGTEVYFTRCTKLNGDTIENFEEISIEDIPSQDGQEETGDVAAEEDPNIIIGKG